MVIVNFKIAMGAESGAGAAAFVGELLAGRAAATFVALAGIGLGLAFHRQAHQNFKITFKRALFLLVIGLLNMIIFDADILHYYAFYFLIGAFLITWSSMALVLTIVGLNVTFLVMILSLNFDAGWNWENYSYQGLWTLNGFFRHLFFNGWHPIIPWLGFLLFGIILSRINLALARTQNRLIFFGLLAYLSVELLAYAVTPLAASIDPKLALLTTTQPIPPMPFYTVAGMGAASVVIGLCLRFELWLKTTGILKSLVPVGRQTLTLYLAHIFIGMGALESFGLLGEQNPTMALVCALGFCVVAGVYAVFWSRIFKRGPVEAIMRKVAG